MGESYLDSGVAGSIVLELLLLQNIRPAQQLQPDLHAPWELSDISFILIT